MNIRICQLPKKPTVKSPWHYHLPGDKLCLCGKEFNQATTADYDRYDYKKKFASSCVTALRKLESEGIGRITAMTATVICSRCGPGQVQFDRWDFDVSAYPTSGGCCSMCSYDDAEADVELNIECPTCELPITLDIRSS